MKIQLFSDLHLERNTLSPAFIPSIAPDTDVVVLAGDIGSYQPGSRLLDQDFGLGRFSPLGSGAAVPPGARGCCTSPATTNSTASNSTRPTHACAPPARNSASNGWTAKPSSSGAGALHRHHPVERLRRAGAAGTRPEQKQAASAATRPSAPPTIICRRTTTLKNGEKVLAEGIGAAMSLACQDWLRGALAAPFDGRTVVVTHFAPSLQSADPRYGLTPGTAGFCNALDGLVPAGRPLDPRSPALRQRLCERGLPRRRESAGVCAQERAEPPFAISCA